MSLNESCCRIRSLCSCLVQKHLVGHLFFFFVVHDLSPRPCQAIHMGDICVCMAKPIPINTGDRFNLLVAERREPNGSSGKQRWAFLCDCGGSTTTDVSKVKRGTTKSCGCLSPYNGKRDEKGKLTLHPGKEPWHHIAKQRWMEHYSDGCSLELFIQLSQQPCHYCNRSRVGCYTVHRTKNYAVIFYYNGLDRIDSTRDHSPTNIVPCCKDGNR